MEAQNFSKALSGRNIKLISEFLKQASRSQSFSKVDSSGVTRILDFFVTVNHNPKMVRSEKLGQLE